MYPVLLCLNLIKRVKLKVTTGETKQQKIKIAHIHRSTPQSCWHGYHSCLWISNGRKSQGKFTPNV